MNRNRELLGGPPVSRPAEADTRRTEVKLETSGMHDAFAALQPLDRNARKRALRWLAEALEDIEVPF
jgi:hypothetical protein